MAANLTPKEQFEKQFAPNLLKGVDESNGKELGHGSYGVVRTVRYQGKEFACKSFYKYLMTDPQSVVRKTFLEECRNAVVMNHDNIVRLCGFYFPLDAQFPSIVMELLPYCLGNQLPTGEIPHQFKPFVLADVANGLFYLHSKNIMHRDLTANNVLLTEILKAKISDFGQAKVITSRELRRHTATPGTPIYMPPEAKGAISSNKIPDQQQQEYDFSLDVFSFGVLILHTYLEKLPEPVGEMIQDSSNSHILHRRPPLDYFHKDIELAVPKGHAFRSLLGRCLDDIPSRRPSTQELVVETQDLKKELNTSVVGRIKKGYVTLEKQATDHIAQEERLTSHISDLKAERNLLWNDLSQMMKKWDGVVRMSSEFKKKQQLSSKPKSFSKPLESSLESMAACEPDNGREAANSDGEDEILMSMRDVRLAQDTFTEERSKELEFRRQENEELWDEVAILREENERLREDKARLERRLIDPDDSSINLAPLQQDSSKSPPTLVVDKGRRQLLEGNAHVTIQDVPQEPLSFNDIKGAQAVYLKGKVYVGRATTSVWAYDTITKTWSKLEDAPCRYYGLAIYQGQLALVGGSYGEGRISPNVLVYSEARNEWDPNIIAPMPQPRENPAVTGYKSFLIAMGGTSTRLRGVLLTSLKSIVIYDGDKWSTAAGLQRPGDTIQCFIESGYLYLLYSDGWTIRYCNVNTLISSKDDPKARKKDIWSSVQRDIPHARSCVFVYDDTLLAISGAGSDGSLYAYDPSTGKWKGVSCEGSLPAIQSATCFPIGQYRQLFLCGGNIDMFTDASKASFLLVVDDVPKNETTGDDQ